MTAKRFALVVPQFPLPFSTPPGEDYFAEPARWMREEGFDVEILCLGTTPQVESEEQNGIVVTRHNSTGRLIRRIMWARYDLIHAHTDFLPSITSGLLARGSRTVLTRHAYVLPRAAWKRRVLVSIFNRFDRILALTPYEHDLYRNAGVAAARITLMPNSINVGFFSRGGNGGRFREQWKIGPDDPVILFVANLRRVKNPETILRSLAEVRRENNRARLVIVGKDLLPEEGGLSAVDLARKHGVAEATVFTDWLGPEPLRDAMTAADVVVNSSFSEGLPLAICEAAAASKPLCLPRIGSLESFFGESAIYHESTDYAALANNILHYLREPELRNRQGEAGFALVKELDVPLARQRLLALYRSLLD